MWCEDFLKKQKNRSPVGEEFLVALVGATDGLFVTAHLNVGTPVTLSFGVVVDMGPYQGGLVAG